MNNRHQALQFFFESIEFRLEIFAPGNSRYPPIFRDIRQAAGGPMYRPLCRLNIAIPALVEKFKSLKVETHLLDHNIKLELALSQRTRPDDYSSFPEQLVGTYLISDGETIELRELAQWGFAPMVAQAARVMAEDVPLAQVPQVNYTTGLQFIGLRKKANAHLVTFKNVSEQAICRYALGVDDPTGASGHFAYETLPAQAEDFHVFHLPPHSIFQPHERERAATQEQSFVIGATMYEDNMCEGQEHWLLELLLPPSGTKRDHIVELQALLQRLYAVPEDEVEAAMSKVRKEAVVLLKRLGFPSDIRVRQKNWGEIEIVENVAMGWMRKQVETAIRTARWMPAKIAMTMSKTSQKAMEAHLNRSQILLRLLHHSK
ncbi:MAG TPA: hypothetical protein VFZ34_11540 [Blastocatellia bacterium]|nr:hypothetical protein [Blastocatellia bacterium]